MLKFTAIYDGRSIHPDEPLPFAPNTRLTISFKVIEPETGCPTGEDGGATSFDGLPADG
jgi:hypothetical protein